MQSIPVLYNPAMVADAQSFSPSASKPGEVVTDWVLHNLPIEVRESNPAGRNALCSAHLEDYVDGVLACKIDNGFGNRSPYVAAALPYQVGSLLDAACLVASRTAPVACSPSAGFHHARYASAHGYCTFNGLMVTAVMLRRMGLARSVGIIDCDYHEGDGTSAIIEHLGASWVKHWTAGAEFRNRSQARDFLRWLRLQVKGMSECDVVIYQAGADAHIDDPLGGMLTTEQMLERDRAVFWLAREYRIPLVWNLAGGYQRDVSGSIKPVLSLHRQTMRACVDIYIHEQDQRA